MTVAELGGATDAKALVATIELPGEAPQTRNYSAVVVHAADGWSALCEDLEVAADGDNAQDAFKNLLIAVEDVLSIDPIGKRPATPPADVLAFLESHQGPEPVEAFVFQVKIP